MLMSEARALAVAMAEMRPEVLAAAKRAVRHGASIALEAAMQEERQLSAELRGSGDSVAGDARKEPVRR